MTDESLILTDAAAAVREALEGLGTETAYTVSGQWPRSAPTGTVITVTELDNAQVSGLLVVDRLSFQIDLWGTDGDAIRTLTPLVNTALLSMGLLRDYAGPLTLERGNYFRKTLRFGRRVDKRSMRMID
ncbi:MAG: hypothetical protein LUH09_09395 [Clostridiales bacterium]|nr:hypothetical protein [Clostridiales bacterium]